jgi:multidrug efflux system outer membrane protein
MKGVQTGRILVLGMGLLGGCASLPEGESVEPAGVEVPQAWVHEDLAGTQLETDWALQLGGARLESLIAEAMAGSFTLAQASARLDQATAVAKAAGGGRWPSLSGSGSASRAMSNNRADPVRRFRTDQFEVGLSTSWEVDLWGRVRAGALAGVAGAEAAAADYRGARLSLAVAVGQSWFGTLAAGARRDLAAETVRSFEANLETVEERFRRGLTPALDLRLTRANVANARATLFNEERILQTSLRQLEVLLGRYPSGSLEIIGELPDVPEAPGAGLPAELLSRRPDLQAAQFRVLQSGYALKESKRSLLPAIRLTAGYGRASSELEDILKDSFDVWNLIGSLTVPIFEGGRLRAAVAQQAAEQEAAVAAYGEALLQAFREVETGLLGEVLLRQQLEAVQVSAEESIGAQQLAEERYARGLVDIITVLEAQRRAFIARQAELEARNALLQNRLSLYLSLGGGTY